MNQCWICYEHDNAKYITPCSCTGTTKYVHETCLKAWVNLQQQTSSGSPVCCPQCKYEYKVVFNRPTPLYSLVELSYEFGRSTWRKVVVYAGLGGLLGSGYVLAMVYGFSSFFFVYGPNETIEILSEQSLTDANPLQLSADELFFTLPVIPVYLLFPRTCFMLSFPLIALGRGRSAALLSSLSMISILYTSARHYVHSQLSSAPVDESRQIEDNGQGETESDFSSDFEGVVQVDNPNAATEGFSAAISVGDVVGTLLMPFVASVAGYVFFRPFTSNKLYRSLLGGAAVVVFRDLVVGVVLSGRSHRIKAILDK